MYDIPERLDRTRRGVAVTKARERVAELREHGRYIPTAFADLYRKPLGAWIVRELANAIEDVEAGRRSTLYRFRDDGEHKAALSITEHRIAGRHIEVKSKGEWWSVNALLEHEGAQRIVNVIDWRYTL